MVFLGIDVACAKGKRLPVCFARVAGTQLEPLQLPPALAQLLPRGLGNCEVRQPKPFLELAGQAVEAIKSISREMNWTIVRVAVDAPAAPARAGTRRCEAELVAAGLSVFRTPGKDEWADVIARCRTFLNSDGALARLPNANRVWMLYGFELFSALREAGFDTIEVYPYAIIHALLRDHPHKSTDEGYRLQLAAIAECTGWVPIALDAQLREAAVGGRHDRLDAFMASWIASLPAEKTKTYGDANDWSDAIWIPVRGA